MLLLFFLAYTVAIAVAAHYNQLDSPWQRLPVLSFNVCYLCGLLHFVCFLAALRCLLESWPAAVRASSTPSTSLYNTSCLKTLLLQRVT